MVKSLSDPNAPKRPLSAFFQWRSHVHNKIKNSMPVSHTFGDLARKFSEEWKALSEAEKKPYLEKHAVQKKTYEKLMTAYKHTENFRRFQRQRKEFKVESAKKGKFAKDPNAPKKPQTAYFAFMADKRNVVKQENPEISHKDVLRKLGELWNGLSDTEKKPYQKISDESRKTYEKAVAEYKNSAGYQAYQASKAQFNKDKKAKVAKLESKLKPKTEAQGSKKKSSGKKKPARVTKKSSKPKKVSKPKGKAKAKKATKKET